jgi:protease IV
MKKIALAEKIWIGREVRLAIAVAILAAFAGFMLTHREWEPGIAALATAVALIAAFYLFIFRPTRIPRDAVVAIRLAGPVAEEPRRSPLDQLLRPRVLTLDELRYALEAAASDRAVRALIVELAGLETGMATAHELSRLLAAVRDGGKRVIAILSADMAGLREYLVASGAGEIVASPDLSFTMLGIATQSLFLKGALDRANVQVQALQWKEYKGAAETFTREAMSPELRESLEAILADWETTLVDAVARSRRLEPARARALLAAGFLSAPAAIEAGLVDRMGYLEDIRAEFDPAGKGKPFVTIGRYLRHALYVRERGRRARIALVHGTGPVVAGEAPPAGEFISPRTTAVQLDRASRDERVRAIVFRVNSPGGSAVGSDLVWRAVREAQGRGKPVVVSMGDVAGSGGYYVAMGADAIVAEPATITGSIGVVYAKFNAGRLLSNLGIRLDYAKTAEVSDAMSVARAMSEQELAQLNQAVGQIYANFTAKVAEGRRLSAEEVERVARGRIWSGIAAKRNGLVDDLGGLSRAVEIARGLARIGAQERHQLVIYAPERRWFRLGLPLGAEPSVWAAELIARALGVPARWVPAALELVVRGGVMLLCPFLGL